ncbi:MAG: polymer-forming cytoskeletal protein [Ferruginibacter sp.]
MFNTKTKSPVYISAGANSLIGAGTIINGDIETNGDIRIDGILNGNLSGSAKILIGPEGIVEGNVQGQQADLLGKVSGSIRITDLLHLRGNAIVKGDIHAGKLQVEPTVTFNGQCHMGTAVIELANIVELKAEPALAVNQ